MLTIGRALMTNPDLLLMDEPSEGLAPLLVQEIGRIIVQLKEGGFSVLLVEQNLSMALSVADYVYVISKGREDNATASMDASEIADICRLNPDF